MSHEFNSVHLCSGNSQQMSSGDTLPKKEQKKKAFQFSHTYKQKQEAVRLSGLHCFGQQDQFRMSVIELELVCVIKFSFVFSKVLWDGVCCELALHK